MSHLYHSVTNTSDPGGRRHGWRVVAVGAALLAGACTTPDINDPLGWPAFAPDGHFVNKLPVYTGNPKERHPISVESSIATLALTGAAGGEELSAAETVRLDGYFRSYLSAGHGQLVVAVAGSGADQERVIARGRRIVEHALRSGLRAAEVDFRIETAGDGAGKPIVLNYDTFVAQVPECGDWSKESSHDVTNSVHVNWGCAMQRNLGVMVVNARDFVTPRAVGFRDAVRSSRVMRAWRFGEPTFAERAAIERARVADVETPP